MAWFRGKSRVHNYNKNLKPPSDVFHPSPIDSQHHNKNKTNKHPNQPKEGDKYIPLANINNATKNKKIHLILPIIQ
ncbi:MULTISPECIES: hypothetical protein [unclassified Microcoleus]|uniref:hypothetical protein n=1 Tax=unclassified Microcoleus TaxID=2642155 RepID=UPI002FD365CF